MNFPFRLCKILIFAVVIIGMMVPTTSTIAQIPSIQVTVSDTTAVPGSFNTPITIFLSNIYDEVAGFNLYIQLDRPDVMIFQTDTLTVYDTAFFECLEYSGATCVDSISVFSWEPYDFFYDTVRVIAIGNFDTTGCLTSGWEFVDTRSLSGLGTDINIVGLADLPGGISVSPIPAGQQGGILLRVLADVFPMDDSVLDRTVNMLVQTDFKDHFSFARADGTSSTWLPLEITDTTCWECDLWVGPSCFDWNKVPRVLGEPVDMSRCGDSMVIAPDTIAILDSANVFIIDGSLTALLSFVCGNMNASPDGQIDIADLVYLVAFMFGVPSGPVPVPYEAGNVDCAGEIDIADLVYFINYMFGVPAGPVPCADCL